TARTSEEQIARLRAALALGRRLCETKPLRRTPLRCPRDVWELMSARCLERTSEHFWALALDARHHCHREILVARGTLASVDVAPREAYRALIRESAFAAIFVHNHPSGDPTPSAEDERLTRQLAAAGKIIGIPLVDHVVVAKEGYASVLGGPSEVSL